MSGYAGESKPYAVDYIADGAWHHTVVMAPSDTGARMHVRTSRPGCTVMTVKRVLPPQGFEIARAEA